MTIREMMTNDYMNVFNALMNHYNNNIEAVSAIICRIMFDDMIDLEYDIADIIDTFSICDYVYDVNMIVRVLANGRHLMMF